MFEIMSGIAIFIVATVVIVIKRGTELRKLAENGTQAVATVEETWKFTGSTGRAIHRMRYHFTASDGQKYKRTVTLTTDECEKLTEGVQVPVIYLADNPKVSAMATMVELARKALDK